VGGGDVSQGRLGWPGKLIFPLGPAAVHGPSVHFQMKNDTSPDPVAVNSMFARIARRYDAANHLLSGGIDVWWRRKLIREAAACRPEVVVDLATGSGDVAFALRRALAPAVRIVGLDFCEPMLEEANRKKEADPRYRDLEFRQGDILSLPLPDASADVVTIAFGLRNLADRHLGLLEMKRILRPGGTLLVLEFTQPALLLRPFYYFYLNRILPRVAGMISGDRAAYEYLNNTISAFPNKQELREEILAAGFAAVTARGLTGSIVALHRARRS
jgi:demethylmenaquinone methyltransferase / 2-methoxy-6-polyprenyl-1,4-benzoquinol methylase